MKHEELEILLVEDDQDHVDLTMRALDKLGLSRYVRVVGDGADALEFLFCTGPYRSRSPDRPPRLILLDLRMPRVDGLEVLRRVKADSRTRDIPIVVLATTRTVADLNACYELGVNSYVVKPVDTEQFEEAVRSLGLYWLDVNVSPPARTAR